MHAKHFKQQVEYQVLFLARSHACSLVANVVTCPMKHLTISSLLLLALCTGVRAQEFELNPRWSDLTSSGMYVSLWVTNSTTANVRQSRLDLKDRCEKDKTECWLMFVEKDGKRLATMDFNGNWTEYGSREDIADVLAMAFRPEAYGSVQISGPDKRDELIANQDKLIKGQKKELAARVAHEKAQQKVISLQKAELEMLKESMIQIVKDLKRQGVKVSVK